MQRHLLGLLALILLVGGISGLAVYGAGESQSSMLSSIGIRMGLVLGAIWLALPQLVQLSGRASGVLLTALVAGGIILAVRPKSFIVLGPILMVLAVLYLLGTLVKPREDKLQRARRGTKREKKEEDRRSD